MMFFLCVFFTIIIQSEILNSPTVKQKLAALSPASARKEKFAETQRRLSKQWMVEKRKVTAMKARADAQPIILEDGSPSFCDSPSDFTGDGVSSDLIENLTQCSGALNLSKAFENVASANSAYNDVDNECRASDDINAEAILRTVGEEGEVGSATVDDGYVFKHPMSYDYNDVDNDVPLNVTKNLKSSSDGLETRRRTTNRWLDDIEPNPAEDTVKILSIPDSSSWL